MKSELPFLDVPPVVRRRMLGLAREFRKKPTKSEDLLWQALRGKMMNGLKFRRQQPVGPMILDFYNSEFRLAIEIDGPIHEFQVASDRERQEVLELLGFNVLRIPAELVESNMPTTLDVIRTRIKEIQSERLKRPPPSLGEGRGGG